MDTTARPSGSCQAYATELAMINYKVDVDLANFFSTNAMSKFKLGPYNASFCKIFVEAKDPDDAAYKTLYDLIDLILSVITTPLTII